MQQSEQIGLFVRQIWSWYARRKRALPWRDLRVADAEERAYRVLVSEMMLQQTQVPRVIGAYKRFLDAFPDLSSLAAASNKEVILAWRGMGYNSRALRLRDAARAVVAEHGGRFPRSMEALRAIPGLGPYTAAAVRNFAWNLPTPCIDTNIRRVLHRVFVGPEDPDGTWRKTDAELLGLAAEALAAAIACPGAARDARNWHAALMDFGSLVQTKRAPRWNICPLTAAGLMTATPRNTPVLTSSRAKREPGRVIAGRFVPNRIIRGRIVDVLRDAPAGEPIERIGAAVAPDWSPVHRPWLRSILDALVRDALLSKKASRFALRE